MAGEFLPYENVPQLNAPTAPNEQTGASSSSSAPPAVGPTNRRLMKEYARILKTPIPNIQAHPLPSNILEWHFQITGTQEPYIGFYSIHRDAGSRHLIKMTFL